MRDLWKFVLKNLIYISFNIIFETPRYSNIIVTLNFIEDLNFTKLFIYDILILINFIKYDI